MWQSVSVWRKTGLDLTVQLCLPLMTPAWLVISPQVCVQHALWRGWFSTGSPVPARFFCQVNQLLSHKTLTILFLHYFIRRRIFYLNIAKISLLFFYSAIIQTLDRFDILQSTPSGSSFHTILYFTSRNRYVHEFTGPEKDTYTGCAARYFQIPFLRIDMTANNYPSVQVDFILPIS